MKPPPSKGWFMGCREEDVRKRQRLPAVQSDGTCGAAQEAEPVQGDQRVGELSQMEPVEHGLEPGDHSLVADRRVKAQAGADRKAFCAGAACVVAVGDLPRVHGGVSGRGRAPA